MNRLLLVVASILLVAASVCMLVGLSSIAVAAWTEGPSAMIREGGPPLAFLLLVGGGIAGWGSASH